MIIWQDFSVHPFSFIFYTLQSHRGSRSSLSLGERLKTPWMSSQLIIQSTYRDSRLIWCALTPTENFRLLIHLITILNCGRKLDTWQNMQLYFTALLCSQTFIADCKCWCMESAVWVILSRSQLTLKTHYFKACVQDSCYKSLFLSFLFFFLKH